MHDASRKPPERCNVAVVGGGPAGLATAAELARLGVPDVIVLERESVAGGIPRHCDHSPFGMREFGRCWRGPRYAKHLLERTQKAGARVHVNTTVVAANADGRLTLATTHGASRLEANRVVLSTGARETPRAARLVSGQRPLGITTTGALQAMIYLKRKTPFKRPLIVGTELISFSALLTCRHAGIKPVAMIEQNNRITARSGAEALPGLLGIPVHLETELVEILGAQRVTGARLMHAGGATENLTCDGVLFTGEFTPESALLRMGHIETDAHSGGPLVDQFGRCSDPAYFAAGNLLRGVETAGWCWKEGVQVARCVHLSLAGRLPHSAQRARIAFSDPLIKYVVPQTISMPSPESGAAGMKHLQLRFTTRAKRRISLCSDSQELQSKSIHALPERRVLLPLGKQVYSSQPSVLRIEIDRVPQSASARLQLRFKNQHVHRRD
ncbi:MAG: NAD(P)/FAD-dependent oxidoreductase [bacterium]